MASEIIVMVRITSMARPMSDSCGCPVIYFDRCIKHSSFIMTLHYRMLSVFVCRDYFSDKAH